MPNFTTACRWAGYYRPTARAAFSVSYFAGRLGPSGAIRGLSPRSPTCVNLFIIKPVGLHVERLLPLFFRRPRVAPLSSTPNLCICPRGFRVCLTLRRRCAWQGPSTYDLSVDSLCLTSDDRRLVDLVLEAITPIKFLIVAHYKHVTIPGLATRAGSKYSHCYITNYATVPSTFVQYSLILLKALNPSHVEGGVSFLPSYLQMIQHTYNQGFKVVFV